MVPAIGLLGRYRTFMILKPSDKVGELLKNLQAGVCRQMALKSLLSHTKT